MMPHFKTKEIIDTYRKILDPLGYKVVEKPMPHSDPWEPEEDAKEKYDKLTSVEIEQELADLRAKKRNLESQTLKLRQKAAEFLAKEGPNDFTRDVFVGTGKGATPNKKVIDVESSELSKISKTISYLEGLQKEKLAEEMTEKFSEEVEPIEEMKLLKQHGPTKLILKKD